MRTEGGKLIIKAAAEMADAEFRASLEAMETPIGGNDVPIAAHAPALGCTEVTDNGRKFFRLGGLMIEHWLQD